MKKILVTGAAGFIGSYLSKALLEKGFEVVGLDNINDYYNVNLKYGRLEHLCGVKKENIMKDVAALSDRYPSYKFYKSDITDRDFLPELFEKEKFDIVCNLAAQAGVRNSITNPFSYAESNLMGFMNVLEVCRNYNIGHLVYASSSSVYGMNDSVPFKESDKTDSPVSLYAATKKANELMAFSYSKLYNLQTTALRFFTVYGPWGRPDMAPFLFMKANLSGDRIRIFNNGDMRRDFTYIDDIVKGITKVVEVERKESNGVPHRIYNIGNSTSIELMDFIRCIESCSGRDFKYDFVEMQKGDVVCTYADTTQLLNDYGYSPCTSINTGVENTFKWFEKWNHLI